MLDEIPRDDPFDSAPGRADTFGVRDAWRAARAQPRRVAAIAAVLAVVTAGAWWVLRPPPPTRPEALLPVVTTGGGAAIASASATTSPTVASTVVVHVAGAVARPGVLHLPAGARVVDAVEAAGGATLDADTDRVNLAAPLADGARIQVPRVGEQVVAPPDGGAPAPSASEPVDINQANASQLEALPGIGPATAAAIVEHRERHGPFTSVDALGDVPGIGDAKLAQLRDLVRI